MNRKYKAIVATDLKVKIEGTYRMVWSKQEHTNQWKMWREEFYEGSESAP